VISWAWGEYVAHQKEIATKAKAEQDENKRLLRTYLLPVATTLTVTESVKDELDRTNGITGYGILESYVYRARQDGEQSESLAFEQMANLVSLDTNLIALLEAYDPDHKMEEFKQESDAFLKHANTYVSRFKALPKVIASGEELPSWTPFPPGFPSALENEIRTRQAAALPPGSPEAPKLLPRVFDETFQSGWIAAGFDSGQWCDQQIAAVRQQYPRAQITKHIANSTRNTDSALHPQPEEYAYRCAVHIMIPESTPAVRDAPR